MAEAELFKKYDVQAPRYTSYPTVPYWCDSPTPDRWIAELEKAARADEAALALYVHIPFCESLCTYCGCNTAITQNHGVEIPYVSTVLREWHHYLERVPALASLPLRELHLGGGTPTFLSAENLDRLVSGILAGANPERGEFEASLEVHPGHTTEAQLARLRERGFRRISMGVQDYDPEVQRLVNRVQPFATTRDLTLCARRLGYTSVNHDLIYGLPAQTLATIETTIARTLEIRPDRIALYSYAHVPWIKQAQRLFTEADLPGGDAKRALYECARERLLAGGYIEIGMDHFALPTDSLAQAQAAGRLHRNFMGYTHNRTQILLGLGVSAISETPDCFHQNEKALKVYEARVGAGAVATLRGHLLSSGDRRNRERILALMTKFSVALEDAEETRALTEFLAEPLQDGLIRVEAGVLKVTERGRPFLRNICMAFDARLRASAPERQTFSRSI